MNDFLIVTPALDAWPRIRAAAASVAAQRSDGLSVRHVVQLHEGSRDPGVEWLRRQTAIDLRIEDDNGLYDAIGRGFKGAAEAYLGWLNADEQLLPGALAQAAQLFEQHPRTDLLFGDYLLLDARGMIAAARREVPPRRWYLRHGVNSILSCATFFRRRMWERLAGFDPGYHLLADKEFYLRALDSGAVFQHVPAFWGAFGLTGSNRSTDPRASDEQARLRRQTGAYRTTPQRVGVRYCRWAEKALRGAYRRQPVETILFDSEGLPRPVRTVVGTRWRWG